MPRKSSRLLGGEEEDDDIAIPRGRRPKKNAEIAKNRKRILDDNDEDNDSDGLNDFHDSDDDDDQVDESNPGSPKSELDGAIRKKKRPKTDEKDSEEKKGDSLTGTIRRRARPEAAGDDSKAKSSLLGNMALPPPSVSTKDKTSKSLGGSNAHHSNATKGAGINSTDNNNYNSYTSNNRRGDHRRQPRHHHNHGKQTVELVNLPHELTPAQQNINQSPYHPHSQIPGNPMNPPHMQGNQVSMMSSPLQPASASTTVSEKRILTQLHQLCDSYHQTVIPPTFDFQRHQSSQSVDLMGSFLRGPSITGMGDDYDFFDTNDQGEIVLQGRKPMFPEEFPPGVKEHPLSWWGILDPVAGQGRYAASSKPGASNAMKPTSSSLRYANMHNAGEAQHSPTPPQQRQGQYTSISDRASYHRQHSWGRGQRSESTRPPHHYQGGYPRRGGDGRR